MMGVPTTGIANGMDDPMSQTLTEEQLIYKENILDHYKHPHNRKELLDASLWMHGRNPLCGDELDVALKLDGNTITEVAFLGSGCAISQATMSMLTDELRGKSVAQTFAMGREDVLALLGIPIGPVRTKCALLGLRTVQRALDSAKAPAQDATATSESD